MRESLLMMTSLIPLILRQGITVPDMKRRDKMLRKMGFIEEKIKNLQPLRCKKDERLKMLNNYYPIKVSENYNFS